MRRVKFIKSADGERIIRLRAIQSVRLISHAANGFVAARIVATLRGGADPVTLAAYTAIDSSPEAVINDVRARAEMDRLLALLNGGRLRKGEVWPKEEEV